MKKRWGKGDPVNLSDLLKITPVANEIMQLSNELEISTSDIMWIVSQIIDNHDPVYETSEGLPYTRSYDQDEDLSMEDEWDDIDAESLEEEIDRSMYVVNVKISSEGRFPEIGFKAGVGDKEDITYFFDMVMEMLDKLE
ncbi:hypothetical protein [Syntrophomonas erecta]